MLRAKARSKPMRGFIHGSCHAPGDGWWRGMMALRWTVGKWAIEKSAIDKAGSQGLIRPMMDFRGVAS
jgi:hypothetical protein